MGGAGQPTVLNRGLGREGAVSASGGGGVRGRGRPRHLAGVIDDDDDDDDVKGLAREEEDGAVMFDVDRAATHAASSAAAAAFPPVARPLIGTPVAVFSISPHPFQTGVVAVSSDDGFVRIYSISVLEGRAAGASGGVASAGSVNAAPAPTGNNSCGAVGISNEPEVSSSDIAAAGVCSQPAPLPLYSSPSFPAPAQPDPSLGGLGLPSPIPVDITPAGPPSSLFFHTDPRAPSLLQQPPTQYSASSLSDAATAAPSSASSAATGAPAAYAYAAGLTRPEPCYQLRRTPLLLVELPPWTGRGVDKLGPSALVYSFGAASSQLLPASMPSSSGRSAVPQSRLCGSTPSAAVPTAAAAAPTSPPHPPHRFMYVDYSPSGDALAAVSYDGGVATLWRWTAGMTAFAPTRLPVRRAAHAPSSHWGDGGGAGGGGMRPHPHEEGGGRLLSPLAPPVPSSWWRHRDGDDLAHGEGGRTYGPDGSCSTSGGSDSDGGRGTCAGGEGNGLSTMGPSMWPVRVDAQKWSSDSRLLFLAVTRRLAADEAPDLMMNTRARTPPPLHTSSSSAASASNAASSSFTASHTGPFDAPTAHAAAQTAARRGLLRNAGCVAPWEGYDEEGPYTPLAEGRAAAAAGVGASRAVRGSGTLDPAPGDGEARLARLRDPHIQVWDARTGECVECRVVFRCRFVV